MNNRKYYSNGICKMCAKKGCNDLCTHYGTPACIRTLKKVGEEFYMKGLDDLGIKYYAMAVYAEDTLGIDKKRKLVQTHPVVRQPIADAKKFESIEERFKRQQAVKSVLGGTRSVRGIFGCFTPTPINRSSAMSFQKSH